MLFQHDPAEPVGVWLELREDHRGLYAKGRLIPEVARGREMRCSRRVPRTGCRSAFAP
jgi:phage head maturation protease